MASKASGTLVPIIEKQHASWSLMVTASPAFELRFCHRLRIASARRPRGPEVPTDQSGGVHVSRADNALPVTCIPPSVPLRCATQQLDTCLKVLSAT